MTRAAVHGLSGETVAAPWPGLTRDELAPVLAAYAGLGAVQGVVWHSPRPFAASGIVACEGASVFVKRHDRRVRSPADLREEHDFIAHLRQAGAPVPAVLRTRGGATAPATETATYEVHALLAHADPYRDAVSWSPFASLAHAEAAGRALAVFHRAARGFSAPKRRTGLLVADFSAFGGPDPVGAIARRAAAEPLLGAALAGRDFAGDAARHLLPLHAAAIGVLADLPPLWTHNDWHASNLLWTGEGMAADVAAVLDFGLANRTTALFDLATAIERNAVSWLRLAEDPGGIGHPDIAAAIVAGYAAVAPLGAAARRALALILPLVHAEFAQSELAYFDGVLGDRGAADAAYDDFLMGHAAWFAGAHGRHFLAALA